MHILFFKFYAYNMNIHMYVYLCMSVRFLSVYQKHFFPPTQTPPKRHALVLILRCFSQYTQIFEDI